MTEEFIKVVSSAYFKILVVVCVGVILLNSDFIILKERVQNLKALYIL